MADKARDAFRTISEVANWLDVPAHVLRFWESIADNRLHPKAAILLANRDMIKAVIPLPHKQQLEIAYGKEIATATQDGQSENIHPPLKRHGYEECIHQRQFNVFFGHIWILLFHEYHISYR